MDPCVSGNFTYNEKVVLEYKPIYIGNSSSYSKYRWADHLYFSGKSEALKNKDIELQKIIYNANLTADEYKNSKFIKRIYLERDVDTQLEKYLIEYYGLANLLNIVPGSAVLIDDKNELDGLGVWDLELDELANTDNIRKFCRVYNINSVNELTRHLIIVKRFCLLSNLNEAKKMYNKHNRYYTFYYKEDGEVHSIVLKYIEARNIMGSHIKGLISGKHKFVDGYVLNKDYLDSIPNNYNKSIINNRYRLNKIFTIRYDEKHKCSTMEYMDKSEITEYVVNRGGTSSAISSLYKGERKSHYGLYVCIDTYSKDYQFASIKNINTGEIMIDVRKNIRKIHNDLNKLMDRSRSIAHGWVLLDIY